MSSATKAPGAEGPGDLIEIVARAIFEADEDLNDAQEARLRVSGNTAAADCLAGPRARWDDPKNAPILDAFRQRAQAAVEAMLKPVLANSYGPPSMWPSDYPKGWRHPPAWPADQRPTPEEACWHDNGVRDVWFALRAALAQREATR